MTVKNLSTTSLDELIECFLLAFENYYVKMPTDRNYYEKRWKAAKVDFNLSYGMMDNGKLVGFIIHAVDNRYGKSTAFNTGTGVVPAYRGKRMVRSIYEYALQDLQLKGIQKSTLEVITINERAIRAYEGVGFNVCKKYRCYAGELKFESNAPPEIKEIAIKNIDWESLPNQQYYSWDFQKETLLEGNNTFFQVINNEEPESYFIFNPENLYVAQWDILKAHPNAWNRLFSAIKQVSKSVKIINVDERLRDKIDNIQLLGLQNTVNQYEMELDLNSDSAV